MLTPCENIFKRFLPALKPGIAKELYENHNMNQIEIAKVLGLTQAAVSKYLSKGVRKTKELSNLNSQLSTSAKKIATSIATNPTTQDALSLQICEECLSLNNNYTCLFYEAHVAAK